MASKSKKSKKQPNKQNGPAKAQEKKNAPQPMVIVSCVLLAAALVAALAFFLLKGGSSPSPAASGGGSSQGSSSIGADSSEALDPTAAQSSYLADIEIQDYGTVTVKLDGQAAPKTVENFVSLANSGFYNGLTFHRIIEGFMMQGGDPEGTGMGGSDVTIPGEFAENGFDNPLSHTRGCISMARNGVDYNSASSQFFIVHQDASASLDGKYAAFGYVTEGMDVVDAICEAAKPIDNDGFISPDQQPVITSITIRPGTEE